MIGWQTMCRWIAYSGSPVSLDSLLFKPEHSLIDQSRHSQRGTHGANPDEDHPAFFMNGDGVGVGWYSSGARPGVYRDIQPAWNDRNLQNVAEHTISGLFLAHIRASSGSAIQQTNCHPFRHDRWLFQHNGEINSFPRLKRAIDLEIDPELYPLMEGSTDSERMFFLALTFGLMDNPRAALQKMVAHIEKIGQAEGVPAPLVMTLAISNGEQLFIVRYASPGNPPPSLYHNRSVHAIREIDGRNEQLPDDALIVLSEPIDQVSEHWEEVPEATFLTVADGKVTPEPFEPE